MKNIKALIVVNTLTLIRIIGTFIIPFVSLKISSKQLIIYIILILITDCLDGILARKLNVCTLFGAMLDALADKLFGISTLLIISAYYPIILLPILTEIIIVIINTTGAIKGSVLESSRLGKIKTWILGICTALSFLIIYSSNLLSFLNISILNITNLAYIMVGADIMVAFDYIIRNIESSKKAKAKGIKVKNFELKQGNELKKALFSQDYYLQTKNQPFIIRLGKEVKNER